MAAKSSASNLVIYLFIILASQASQLLAYTLKMSQVSSSENGTKYVFIF